MHTKYVSVRDLVYISLGAALISLCAFITVPSTIPFTLQTFAVFFLTALLGTKRGFFSVLVYLALGALGVPVFSGFRGGFGVLLGPTGGYIVGFVLAAVCQGLLTLLWGKRLGRLIASMAIGLLVCYAFGTLWFALAYGKTYSVINILSLCVFPYLIPDAVKIVLAAFLAKRLSKWIS